MRATEKEVFFQLFTLITLHCLTLDKTDIKQQDIDDVDALYVACDVQDIFGASISNGNNMTNNNNNNNNTITRNGDLFPIDFGNNDIFCNNYKSIHIEEDKSSQPVTSHNNTNTNDNVDGFDFGATSDDNDVITVIDAGSGGLFDDEFDDDQAIQYSECLLS